MPRLRFKLPDLFQSTKRDPLLPAGRGVALGDGQPDGATMLVKGRILKRPGSFEPILANPVPAVEGDVNIEHASEHTLETGLFLPAEIIGFTEAIERRLRVGAIGNLRQFPADSPVATVGAGRKEIVSSIVAADGQPATVGQSIDC